MTNSRESNSIKSPRPLGCTTNAEVLAQFVDLKNKFVIDAGCGNLVFTRILMDQGARVLAIDPDAAQAELNRQALSHEPVADLQFQEGGAESIPVEDHTVDGVFFSYSLHHVPADSYRQVFAEVLRVIKPGGFLYVLEPSDCAGNEVMKLFHDEDAERAAAQQALRDFAWNAFKSVDQVIYHSIVQYESWEKFADNYSGRTFNPGYTDADVRSEKVKAAFFKFGTSDHCFESAKQVAFFRDKK